MVVQQQAFQKIPVESWEIGAELLDILSRGLYSDAKDAIREYVQNGVDAEATTVIVNVRGPKATIRDNGVGMDWDTLRRARRFGISDKNPRIHVGFRGIGIYAAFGMCETMRITTRQAGTDDLLHLEIRFGEMRRIIEQERVSADKLGVGLSELLEDFTWFLKEPYDSSSLRDQFTLVSLDGITQEYRSQLNDTDALNAYLLNTLPVAFPDEGYGSTVNGWLREHAGLNPIKLVCRVGDEPEFNIEPHLVEDVEPPQNYLMKDSKGEEVAFVWHALTTRGERIPSPAGTNEGSGASGYLMKVKGFTLGDRLLLKRLWPATGGGTLYHHYTGEVHILDHAEVYPNAARDDLEASLAKQNLVKQLEDIFIDWNRRADLTRDIIKTERRMHGIRETLQTFEGRDAEADQDPFELYRESKNFLEMLERTERDMLRLRRGRRAVQPTERQKTQLELLRVELRNAHQKVNSIIRATERRTASTHRGPRKTTPAIPPRVALIAKAREALRAMLEGSNDPSLEQAGQGLTRAIGTRSVAQAVTILDDLKASRGVLSESVEASRKELRVFLGWSPVGPVSLEEALSDAGFLAATDREVDMIQAIDNGLLSGLGNRGEHYQTAIRAVAESVSDHDGLQ